MPKMTSKIRANSLYGNILLWTSFCLLQVNKKKPIGMVSITVSTNHFNKNDPTLCFLLKVQSCKLPNNKYVITSTQITNTEIFAFIAVLVLSY